MMQRTLAIFKPDLVKRNCRERVIKTIEANNLRIVASKRIDLWPRREVERFYSAHKGRFFYERLVNYMGSGPIEALVLEGPNAIQKWRDLIGPTHLQRALQQPECLRAQYAQSDTKNSFHGSDSVENAEEEISFFFPELFVTSTSETKNPSLQ